MRLVFFSLALILVFLNSCQSVEQYNKKLITPISMEKLQKDIDYTQHQLNKFYPNLHGFISKEKLDFKFDSIRKVVNRPMTTKEFYFVISPVIASVRQGHMSVSPLSPRITKSESKRLKKMGLGPFSQFTFEWQNDKMFITTNKSSKKNIKPAAEIISINTIKPQDLYFKYRNSMTSDGFNTTYINKGFLKRYVAYMIHEIGIKDSLNYVFKQNDSVFNETIVRLVKEEKKQKKMIAKDSIITTDSIKKDKKLLVKNFISRKTKRIFGYNELSKDFSKSLKIVSKDSSVAVLKIKDFSKGNYKKAYNLLFDSIKKLNIKTIIIDVRDNPGGRVADVVDLYGYLTQDNYTILAPAGVTSKTSLWKSGAFKSAPIVAYPFIASVYPFYMTFSYFKTTKNREGNYQYKLTGARELKPKANNFKGKIYVMINGGSFSASCILASSLKANKDVVFVGEETGGGFNGTVAGLMPMVKLPNSNLPLRLGLMDIKTTNQSTTVGRGIFPDVEIIPSILDIIKKNDPELEWILKDINLKTQIQNKI